MKKWYYSFLRNFQSIISLQALKLELNKRMPESNDEQGITKLRPDIGYYFGERSTRAIIKKQ